MKRYLFLFTISMLFCTFSSCERPPFTDSTVGESFDFEIPSNFDWTLFKPISVNITSQNPTANNANYIVEIYETDKLLAWGYASQNKPFQTKLSVRNDVDTLTVIQRSIYDKCTIALLPLSSDNVTFDFSNQNQANMQRARAQAPINTSCPAGAISIPADGQLESGETYYIPSGYTVSNANLVDNVTIYVDGEFQLTKEQNGVQVSGASLYVSAQGKLGVKPPFYVVLSLKESLIYNEGEFKTRGLLLNDNVQLINKGNMDIDGIAEFEDNISVQNSHIMKFHSYFNAQDNISIFNSGFISVVNPAKFIDAEVTITAGAYLKGRDIAFNDSKLKLEPNAKASVTSTLTFRNSDVINELNTTHAVLLSNKLVLSPADMTQGKICFDYNVTYGEKASKYNNEIVDTEESCMGVFVPSTVYNNNGYNAPPLSDDGNEIFYPDRSYTVAMEDNFPNAGDMDMNDLVYEWCLGRQINTDNKIEKIGVKIKVKAVGATKVVAGAFRINNLQKLNVKSVTVKGQQEFSNYFVLDPVGFEKNNAHTVIPLFEDAHKLFGKTAECVNTWDFTENPYQFETIIEFNSPIATTDISENDINVFSVISGDLNYRTEVHTYGNVVTPKAANQTNFSDNHKIWSLQFLGDFCYPKESISILSAYPDFQKWVESSGNSYESWFENPVNEKVVDFIQ